MGPEKIHDTDQNLYISGVITEQVGFNRNLSMVHFFKSDPLLNKNKSKFVTPKIMIFKNKY